MTDGSETAATADAEELRAVSLDWAAAIVSNDPAQIARFLSDDWVIVSETGISPREHFLALVASGDLTHTAMELTGPPRLRSYEQVGLVTGRVTNTAYYRGDRTDADEWTTDVFVNRAGSWLCVLSHITPAREAATS